MRHLAPLLGGLLACTPLPDPDPEPLPTEEDRARAEGIVRDGAGAAVEGAQVNLCLVVCRTELTDEAGAFVHEVPPGTYSFHVVPPAGSGLAEPLVPLTLAEGDDLVLDVDLPSLEPAVALPLEAEEIEIAPGVFATTRQGDLTVLFEDDPTEVAGVRVDEAAWPPLELDGTVLGVWVLSPYEAEADPGMPLRLAETWDLPEGSTHRLYRSDYWSYGFVEVAELEVEGDWLVDDDARLEVLTTLVLVEGS